MQRIFLVGCPRSGTTIFQSLLAAHPEIMSFPETKIFHYTLREEFVEKLPGRLAQFFNNEINRPELLAEFHKSQGINTTVRWFLGILDRLTIEQNKRFWIEKTPEHIFFLTDIARFQRNAKFIHITRNGLDTIASIYEATRMPQNELWGGKWSLDYCIKRWRACNWITKSCDNNPQHLVVRYEDLLSNKVATLTKCFDFIGVDYSENILSDYKKEAIKLALDLPWHNEIDREIKAPLIPKYQRIFQEHIIDYILRELEV